MGVPGVPPTANLVAEFIGTYMLVLTVGCNVLTGSPIWAVTSIACTLMVMIYATGSVSGGHLNPAVSLATLITGDEVPARVGSYMLCQILGGICAGLSYSLMFWEVFNLAPSPGFNVWQAGVAEFMYTFMLVFVVLNVAYSKDGGNDYYGLAIAFTVVAGGYGAGHISGGCFNPAVALGIDLSSAGLGFGYSLAYTGFEFLGAAAAAFLYKAVRKIDENAEGGPAPPLGAKLLSEFLGTFMLVLTVGLNVIGGSKAPVFSIAASLMCMIYALGSVSGANFNPAVTLCLLLTNRPGVMSAANAWKYVCVQLVGGILAGVTYMAMEGGKSFPLGPGKNYTLFEAGFAEIIFTFVLCYVVCTTATLGTEKNQLTQFFGLAIGSCVTAGGYAIGAVSGGSLNPAVSFGIAAAHSINGGGPTYALAYTVFECVGAILAAGLFCYTHADDKSRPSLTRKTAELPRSQ